MRFVDNRLSQFDGSAYAAWNCVAATTAALIAIATVGRIRVSGAAIRAASGVKERRGLYQSEAADAAVRLTGVVLESRFLAGDGTQRGKLRNLIVSGRAVSVMIDTNVTAGTDFRTGGLTYTYRGLHQIALAAYRWRQTEKPQAEFYVDDPGDQPDRGWRWWPADLIYRAAEKAGGGGIWIMVARDTEGVKRAARQAAHFRAQPQTDSGDRGPVVIGRNYYVRSTTRGGPWKRDNGTDSVGWHAVVKGDGSVVYVKGEALA